MKNVDWDHTMKWNINRVEIVSLIESYELNRTVLCMSQWHTILCSLLSADDWIRRKIKHCVVAILELYSLRSASSAYCRVCVCICWSLFRVCSFSNGVKHIAQISTTTTPPSNKASTKLWIVLFVNACVLLYFLLCSWVWSLCCNNHAIRNVVFCQFVVSPVLFLAWAITRVWSYTNEDLRFYYYAGVALWVDSWMLPKWVIYHSSRMSQQI